MDEELRSAGWKSHEAVERNLQDLLDEHRLYDDCTDRSIESSEWAGELRLRTKDGKVGFSTSVLTANTDITSQKATDTALIEEVIDIPKYAFAKCMEINNRTHRRIYFPAAESGIGHPDKRVAYVKTT